MVHVVLFRNLRENGHPRILGPDMKKALKLQFLYIYYNIMGRINMVVAMTSAQ